MATLPMPNETELRRGSFTFNARSQVFNSELVGSTQTAELQGEALIGDFEVVVLPEAAAAKWQAFLVKLGGRDGRFFGFDPLRRTPNGAYNSGLDIVLVKGAGQAGRLLVTDGWRASITNVLLAGDYLEITVDGVKRMHMNVDDVSSDSGGNATLNIMPPLRGAPADNLALVINNPVCEMMLTSDDAARWRDRTDMLIDGLQFTGIEALG